MVMPQNQYIRELNRIVTPIQPPRIENGILLTPDGLRWRIETMPLTDLLHVGDNIRTNYSSGGVVIKLNHQLTCCCPLRHRSGTKYCYKSWDEPAITREYHIDVWTWTIVYVSGTNLKVKKDGTLYDNDNCGWINEMVGFNGRMLKLFENNQDEVFLENAPYRGKPFQISMSF